jgi:hypothetical protein
VVVAYGASDNAGKAYAFEWSRGDFRQVGPSLQGDEDSYSFGVRVSISSAGDRIAASSTEHVVVFDEVKSPSSQPSSVPSMSPTCPPGRVGDRCVENEDCCSRECSKSSHTCGGHGRVRPNRRKPGRHKRMTKKSSPKPSLRDPVQARLLLHLFQAVRKLQPANRPCRLISNSPNGWANNRGLY